MKPFFERFMNVAPGVSIHGDTQMSEANGSSNKILAKLERVENVFRSMLVKIEEIDKKVDQLLYEDVIEEPEQSFPTRKSDFNDFVDDPQIRQNGQKIPYNKLEGMDQIAKFRAFLSQVRMHEDKFSQKEYEFAGFADKNFSDIRISDNSRRILGTAYQRYYGKPWEFRFMRGYMYKWQGQMAWEWEDGSLD